MAQLTILLIALSLLILLAWLCLRREHTPAAFADPPAGELAAAVAELALRSPALRKGSVHPPRRLLQQMNALLKQDSSRDLCPLLHEYSRELSLLLLQRTDAPPLPADEHRRPRMLLLARELVRRGLPCDGETLSDALILWQDAASLTHQERVSLPACVHCALEEQLASLLSTLRADLRESERGRRLARQLYRSKRPSALLASSPLTPACLQAMIAVLRKGDHAELLVALEDHLRTLDLSTAELSARHARSQTVLAEELMHCLTALRSLSRLNWPEAVEIADPLHQLLLRDPAEVYPLMTVDSRMQYRCALQRLAKLIGADELRMAHRLLMLCRQAEPDGTLEHVGWYLLEPDGQEALRRFMQLPRGRVVLWLARHRVPATRAGLILANTILAFVFLHTGHSLWALPLLLPLTGLLLRRIARHTSPGDYPAPVMALEKVPEEQRVLVVLLASLEQRSAAIPMVRRLLLASHAMPEGAVDCLLLADYGDCLTATSGEDEAITWAASQAVEAIDRPERRFMYLHRARSYDRRLHRYTGREGRQGALQSLRRLILDGVCPDEFDVSTIPASFLQGRYTCVLTLTPETTPAPDMLLPLLGAMLHPLNRRRAAMISPCALPDPRTRHSRTAAYGSVEESCRCWLLDPRRVEEQTDLPAGQEALQSPVLSMLAGCIPCRESQVFLARPAALRGLLTGVRAQVMSLWQQFRWLLPWQDAAQGVESSPLSSADRWRLRCAFGDSLLPALQLAALLYAALTRSLPVFILALMADLPGHGLALASRWLFMPLRAAIRLDGIWRALWLRFFGRESSLPGPDTAEGFSALENWSQGLFVLLMAAASLLQLPPFWPGLVLAAGFACFPLVHTWLDQPLRRTSALGCAAEADLADAAQATWRYFEETVTPATHGLPPEGVQVKPWRGVSGSLLAEDAGLYLLACVSAKELGLISADTMAERIAAATDGLEKLPLWQGLPYQRYRLEDLNPAAPRVDTAACGILRACLLCAAQALRMALPDTSAHLRSLPARLDALAEGMNLSPLFDRDAWLLFTGLNTDTAQPDPSHHALFASLAVLASFTAVMRREVPLHHLESLARPRVRLGSTAPLCSPHGSVQDYLLPLLLLPLYDSPDASDTPIALLRAQKRSGMQGMFGASECAVWQFDGQMNYLRRSFGLPEITFGAQSFSPVFAPYAAALCLAADPVSAHECLMRLRNRSVMGRLGYYDSLDMDPARLPADSQAQPVQCHLSGHQAMLLCALCSTLTADSLQRIFLGIPSAASYALALCAPDKAGPVLPARALRTEAAQPREPSFRRIGVTRSLPLDAHLIGTPEASLLLSAHGTGSLASRGVPLTRFTGDAAQTEGPQFFIGDGSATRRLGDPSTESEVFFAEGSIRLTQLLGALQCTLTALVDPASGTFVHTLEMVNLSGSERFAEVTNRLIPGFSPDGLYQPSHHSSDRVIVLAAAGEAPLTLCHVLTAADPLIALETDACNPAEPSVGFRARLSLGARGRATLVYTTRLLQPGEAFSLESLTPRATDLPGLATLSRLCCRAAADALGADQASVALCSRAVGPVLWQGQPHQGAAEPLTLPPSALAEAGLDSTVPLITLLLYTPSGLSLAQEVLLLLRWLAFSGRKAQLCLMCMGDEADAAHRAAGSLRLPEHACVLRSSALPDGLRATIEALSRLVLYEGAGSLSDQLDSLRVGLSASPAVPGDPDSPAFAPEELRFSGAFGGFQPQTDDCILRLSPGESAPGPWPSLLRSGGLSCLSPVGGPGPCTLGDTFLTQPLREGVAEFVLLEAEGNVFSPTPVPMGGGLHHRIQHSPGQTVWRSTGFGLDMTLCAGCIPGESCFLRTLRLKNKTARDKALTLTLAADAGPLACLIPVAGGVSASLPGTEDSLWLLFPEGECTFRRMSRARFLGLQSTPAGLHDPGEDVGSVALMTMPLRLAAGGSLSLCWLTGASASADRMEALCRRAADKGASALLRSSREAWASGLSALTLALPEDSLNLLLNRLLPHQALLYPHAPINAAARLFVRPDAAVESVMRAAEKPDLLLPLMAAEAMRITGDAALLLREIGPGETLHHRCMAALTSVRLGRHGLPLQECSPFDGPRGSESLRAGLLFAMALERYAAAAPQEDRADILEVHARLLSAIDRNGWDGSWFLMGYTAEQLPLCSAQNAHQRMDGFTQALSVLALGDTDRTRQAMASAWAQLWDPRRGMLHAYGPPSGGENTLHAACFLRALCRLGLYEEAWQLARALNPALRAAEASPLPPWLLPGALDEAGRALSPDVPGAAGYLYHVVLTDLLGLARQGDRIRLVPHVPAEWDHFTLTWLLGSSTWHMEASRDISVPVFDGEELPDGWAEVRDDGHIHQLRVPLT